MRAVYCSSCDRDVEILFAEPPRLVWHKETWLLRLRCACRDALTETYSDMREGETLPVEYVLALQWQPWHAEVVMEKAEREAVDRMNRVQALRAWLLRGAP